MEMGWKPNTTELSPACPRCGSSNTKFCYYNNYSLTQPRYFCKGCRRYWTKGGSLRNVPVGGGCRKTRRGRSTRAAASRNASHTNRSVHEPIACSSAASTSIDLAAVYANFLNQPHPQPPPPPENRAATTLAELPDGIVIPPPLEFSGLQMGQLSSYLPQENGFFECGSSFLGVGGGNNSNFFGGLTATTAAAGSGFGGMNVLPPLPGEEAAAWPNSEMLLNNQILPLGLDIIGEEAQPTQQNLSGNTSPLSGFNLEAFFGS